MDLTKLSKHIRERPAQLDNIKMGGGKIIGYFPGNYVPEELIYASGAVPICLVSGGDSRAAEAGLAELPHLICPFARAQVGERILKRNPYYGMLDMLVAPITCQHLKKVAELWEYRRELEIFKLGIPHQHGYEYETAYFKERLHDLKRQLELVTGNRVTQDKLKDSIQLYNRIRRLFKEISLIRRSHPSQISSVDFVKLNHASFLADPIFLLEILEDICQEFRAKEQIAEGDPPRILLVGPNLSDCDYRVLEMVESAGGQIVIEEFCEGVRYYWDEVDTEGDLHEALTKSYLRDRIPCAFMRNSTEKRFDFIQDLIRDFSVDGVIWYELLCCETYDSEAYYFSKRFQEMGVPMLILESDYGAAATGQCKIRIEAFLEILRGVL